MLQWLFYEYILMSEPFQFHLTLPLFRDKTVHTVLGDLLTLYVHEGQFSCFVLFCLELLLCSEGAVENSWPSLTSKQRLLCLDVLTAVVCGSTQSKSDSVPSTAILFFANYFKVCFQGIPFERFFFFCNFLSCLG